MNHKSQSIFEICEALLAGKAERATDIARQRYPFVTETVVYRQYTKLFQMHVFLRDGFIDRYSGERLVFPATLRLLSHLMPNEFPYHTNWKMSECHEVYWELSPTIDHIVPVARGGINDETNCVSTSMLRNSAKANWTLQELGWELLPPGNFQRWDGLTGWFLKYIESNPTVLGLKHIKGWHDVVLKTLGAMSQSNEQQ